MTPTEHNDAWLESLLSDNLKGHLDDAGFTVRVLGALPEKKERKVTRRDVAIGGFSVAAAAAGALAFLHAPMLSAAEGMGSPARIGAVLVVIALSLWGAAAASEA